jgi:hypothetical protein
MIHSIKIYVNNIIFFLFTTVILKVNPIWTDKIKNQIVLSYSCLPIPSLPLYYLSL